jgi:TatD DNase family protein
MLIDAHTHIDRFELTGEDALASALDEIHSRKIFSVSNSMDLSSYDRNREIASTCAYVLPIFGVHPWNASHYVNCLESMDEAIDESPMIGEIGLDTFFVDDESEYPKQRKVLEYFFAASKQLNKIVNLHTKGAEETVYDLVKEFEIPRVIVHWYSGPLDVFEKLADIGCYFTVGIEALYSEHVQTIARSVPSDRLLTETDNPGGPKAFIGNWGTPGLIEDVVQKVAKLRDLSSDEALMALVRSNLLNLIGDDPGFRDTNLALLLDEENDV